MAIGIQTRRYSAVVEAFAISYGPELEVQLDNERFLLSSRPLASWCTNGRLKAARDFQLRANGRTLLFFHDHPAEMGADLESLELVQSLASQKLLRFWVPSSSGQPNRRSILSELSAGIRRTFGQLFHRSGAGK